MGPHGLVVTPPFFESRYLLPIPQDKEDQHRDGYSMAETAKVWVSANGQLPNSTATIAGSEALEGRNLH